MPSLTTRQALEWTLQSHLLRPWRGLGVGGIHQVSLPLQRGSLQGQILRVSALGQIWGVRLPAQGHLVTRDQSLRLRRAKGQVGRMLTHVGPRCGCWR